MGRLNHLGARTILIIGLAVLVTLMPALHAAAEQHVGHGIVAADMDLTVDPAVDFYRYANGGWLDRTDIPPDFASVETLSYLEGHVRLQLVNLLEDRSARGTEVPGTDQWKIVRLYQQGVDLETRNAQAIAPIQPILADIDAIDDLDTLHQFLRRSVFSSVPGFFFVAAAPDLKNSAETVAYLQGPPLSLPGRDYYTQENPTTVAARDAYMAASAQLLDLSGWNGKDPAAAARAVYELERAMAAPTLTPAESQDLARIYNPMTLEELAASYPLMDWPAYLQELGLPDVSRLIVAQKHYLAVLDGIVRDTPLPVLKDFLRLQLLWSASPYLSEAIESAAFSFNGKAMLGLEVLAPVEGRTLDYVNQLMGDALGQLYVAAYFSPEAKARSAELVQELISSFRQRLETNQWMTPATRERALAKLAKLRVKVGYPDEWDDYNTVEITDSYFGSVLSAYHTLYRRGLDQIGQPVDKDAWLFPPQTVNAMYNALNNEIIIPAAVLQPPFFDADADPASNYGGIGFVVGHEITHGLDLTGSQFDGDGNLANWWSPEDYQTFQALNDRVVAQYSAIQGAPGTFVNGQSTVTENVADLGGIQVAYDALEAALRSGDRPALDATGLTQEQRFFVAAATVWRAEVRDSALLTQLAADTHAPSEVRGTQPLRNCDAFYRAFDIEPGDPMYSPPEDRVVIW